MDLDRLCSLVRADRLRDLTYNLVAIPSPTGQARECTEFYADRLRRLGVDVAMEGGSYPDQPSAVGRLRGAGGGTFQLDAHTDTVPLPHAAPVKLEDRVVGRGATDMKGALAIMAEVAAVIMEAGTLPPGDLLLTAHDLHEAPGGLGESLTDLCRRGIHGDVAIVCEGAHDVVPLVARGMAILELRVVRDGDLCHEKTGEPNPLDTVHEVMARLLARRREMAARPEDYVGPETIFVGQVHGGAFYNQIPTEVLLNGTWRFSPRKRFEDAQEELTRLLESVPRPESIRFDLRFFQVRPSYELAPDEPLVRCLQDGYAAVHGEALPLSAAPVVYDAPVLIREAGIPCVGHGPVTHGAHGEPEWIGVEDMVRTTQVYLRTMAAWWEGRGR